LIQINCTIGGASDWVLLVECWPLPLVDDGAGRTTTAKGSKAKEVQGFGQAFEVSPNMKNSKHVTQ
jgi:hypothetical protein